MSIDHPHKHHHSAISIVLALIIHVLVFTAYKYASPKFESNIRTVPVVLISPQGSTPKSTSAKPSEAKPLDELISTTSDSEFLTPNSPHKEKKIKPKSSTPPLPALKQSHRQQKSREGLSALFSQHSISAQPEQIRQISTNDSAPLSEYQKRLIQHMLQGKLYDKFHRILTSSNRKALNYTLNLWLLPSGAIKNASIKNSSGLEELDKLALTAAYNASPYPKPPAKDYGTRFQYEVPVQYQP